MSIATKNRDERFSTIPAVTADAQVGQPAYGTTDHYLGDKGKDYLDRLVHRKPAGRILDKMVKFQPYVKATDTIADFGCGSGDLLFHIRAGRKIGVEINPHARKHAEEAYALECYDDASKVEDGICDVIVSNHALEHVPYPIGALQELRKKIKPDGLLVLCLPVDWRTPRMEKYNPNDVDMHLHTWTPQLIGNTLKSAGFAPESIKIWAHGAGWQRYVPKRFTTIRQPYFNSACWAWSMITRRRQLFAVARPA